MSTCSQVTREFGPAPVCWSRCEKRVWPCVQVRRGRWACSPTGSCCCCSSSCCCSPGSNVGDPQAEAAGSPHCPPQTRSPHFTVGELHKDVQEVQFHIRRMIHEWETYESGTRLCCWLGSSPSAMNSTRLYPCCSGLRLNCTTKLMFGSSDRARCEQQGRPGATHTSPG